MKFFYLKKSKKMLKKFQKLKLIILRIETNFSDFSIILKPFGDLKKKMLSEQMLVIGGHLMKMRCPRIGREAGRYQVRDAGVPR